VGAPDIVFADGPPPNAETAQLRLPRPIVERIASLEFGGAALHTDFIHLDRYVARLQADQASAVVLVLGPKSAVLDVHDGAVTVVEPASSSTSGAVIKQAKGWIIVITGSLQPQPSIAASPRDGAAAAEKPTVEPPVEVAPAPVEVAPVEVAPVEVVRVEAPPAAVPPLSASVVEMPPVAAPPVEPSTEETAPVKTDPIDVAPPVEARPAEPVANGPSGPAQPALAAATGLDSVFGRFAGDARYLLSPGVADNLPPEVEAVLAGVGRNGVTGTVLRLLDGAHTLAEIAAETGLTPGQVGGILEALVSHRLAFKYVSRPRPAAGASASR
jgi:hypothetical protein